jgi:plasmid stabilization system protein ParE
MELEVYWLDLAEHKLEAIYEYYSIKVNKKIAKKLITGIVNSTIGIKNQPEIGQIELNLKHREKEFRYLVYKNYKIVYWVNYDSKRVEIANVFDTRQDPNKLDETK